MFALVASILLTLICFLIGPLFRTLPNVYLVIIIYVATFFNFFFNHSKACLAAMIVVALKNMALQLRLRPEVYRTSKIEAVSR